MVAHLTGTPAASRGPPTTQNTRIWMVDVGRSNPLGAGGAPVIAAGQRGIVRRHVVTAVDVLRARLADPWMLDALAEEIHLSRSHLVRAFDATVWG